MIRLENLRKAYGAKVLFNNVTYHFPQGERVALVGPNGAGKTTLLNLMCKIEEADTGSIIQPQKLVLGYLPQEPNANPAPTVLEECTSGAGTLQDLKHRLEAATKTFETDYNEIAHAQFEKAEELYRAAGGYALESRCKGILLGLGFHATTFEKDPRELSGGWRMRLELARIFVNDPDFLILDEPTNHLDLPSLVWVEKYLQNFPGTLLFVSHDKDLLNRLATTVLHLHGGQISPYKGNFDDFLEQRALRMQQEASAAEAFRKQKEALEKFITRFGAKASKAAQAQSRVKMLARLTALESDNAGSDDVEAMSFALPEPSPSGKEVFRVEHGAIGYSSPLSKNINLKVFRGQKIAIIGANGIGKSTLLKTIVEKIAPLEGEFTAGHNAKLAYFAQDQLDVLDPDDTILGNVLSSSKEVTEKQARSLLGNFLFKGDDAFKPVRVLSGGEKSRVGLACLLVKSANFLILDEPTNHLDMSSAEILANAIADYEGTVLYVSHDRAFINNTCTHVFAMIADGRSALFEGQLDDYMRLAAVADFPNVLDPEGSMAGLGSENGDAVSVEAQKRTREQERQDGNTLKKERSRLEKLCAKYDAELSQFNAQIQKLEAKMVSPEASDFSKAREWQKEFADCKKKLSVCEDEWLDATEKLEAIVLQLQDMGRA